MIKFLKSLHRWGIYRDRNHQGERMPSNYTILFILAVTVALLMAGLVTIISVIKIAFL